MSVTSGPARRTRPSVDPHDAEHLIHQVLGRGSVADLDVKAAFAAKQYLLTALIADKHFDDAGLDAFLGVYGCAHGRIRTPSVPGLADLGG
jgi:hypothetical protein